MDQLTLRCLLTCAPHSVFPDYALLQVGQFEVCPEWHCLLCQTGVLHWSVLPLLVVLAVLPVQRDSVVLPDALLRIVRVRARGRLLPRNFARAAVRL